MFQQKTYFIKTFGCQSNKSDSERIAGDYEARGYKEVSDWKIADEVVINTCAVRQKAEDRVHGFINNLKIFFEANKERRPKLILTGCMTHHGHDKLREMFPTVDEILPINEVGFNQEAIRKDKHTAWIPISIGCNSFCTFCIVPYARGREQSRSMESILEEAKKLAAEGYRDITLLGQNVNSYGLEKTGIGYRKLLMSDQQFTLEDIPSNPSQYEKPSSTPPFVTLLREISKLPFEKIRFMTSNPWDFWDELIEEIANNPKIDRFIHLPIQSGSDKMLKLMNRGYTVKDYERLVEKIRNKIPDCQIGTDIIVGFPGETSEDFQETVDLSKRINWSVAFVAQYSPRPGTAAHRIYKDELTPQVKKARWEELDYIINKVKLNDRPDIP